MSTTAAIEAEGLTRRFGPVRALDGVDLELPPGNVLALLGPNGAGKTTTVRILATLLRPDAGRARVAGHDVISEPRAVRRLIGLSGQYAAVDPFLTGNENLLMIGRLYGLDRRSARRRASELVERVGLRGAAGRTARTYSGGMRRRLDLAASLLGEPRVLFLDEPTTGLDPHGRIGIWQLLAEAVGRGTSLLLTTQDMDEAERLADLVTVIDRGRVVTCGTVDELKTRIGGERLELHAAPGQDPQRLANIASALGSGPPSVDSVTGRVVVPVSEGAALLPVLAAWLAAAECEVAELGLRRPTLEDVFLALTDRADDIAATGAGTGG